MMSTNGIPDSRRFSTAMACATALVMTMVSGAAQAVETISFNDLSTGTVVNQVFSDEGTGPIPVDGFNPAAGEGLNAAVIFDSAAPTGDPCGGAVDIDLGTPNETFGGPGVGPGGEVGSPFQNDTAQEKILIINEACGLGPDPVLSPNDADFAGSFFTFDFSGVAPVTITGITLIDVEADEPNATVQLRGEGGLVLLDISLPQTGDNGVAAVSFPFVEGAVTMVVDLNGSGAIDDIEFERVPLCGNGIVEPELGETCDPPGSIPDTPPGNTNECRVNCTYCGDGIVNNGEECDDPNDPRCTDDCKLRCELDVEKFCTVPEPVVSDDECDSDNGDLLELEFEFQGGDCGATNAQSDKIECEDDPSGSGPGLPADIVITKDPDKVEADPDVVLNLGDRFTVAKFDKGEQKKLGGDTEFDVVGSSGTQSLKIHTSCSQPLVLGDVYGSVRLVSVTTEKGGTSSLPDPGPPVLSEVCEVVGGRLGSCADGKPKALVFRYTGADCGATNNSQKADKVDCSGSSGGDGASIVITKDENKVSANPSTVNVGDLVTISTTEDKFGSETEFDVGGQSLRFHTSCSQPLAEGDVFGSMTLERFIPEGGSLQPQDGNVTYTYRVSHNDDEAVSVNLLDDQGLLGPDGTDVLVQPGQTVELTEEAVLTETTFNTVTASDNDEICAEDSASVLVEVVEPPGSCDDGDPKTLVFEYTGEGCGASNNTQTKDDCFGDPGGALATVTVTKDEDEVTASPTSGIDIGDEITVTTSKDDLPSEIELDVTGPGGTQTLAIHTSCSDNLIVGEQFGSLILRVFVPKQ